MWAFSVLNMVFELPIGTPSFPPLSPRQTMLVHIHRHLHLAGQTLVPGLIVNLDDTTAKQVIALGAGIALDSKTKTTKGKTNAQPQSTEQPAMEQTTAG
jgi:hypothetical protein